MASISGVRAGSAFVELSVKTDRYNAALKESSKRLEEFGKKMAASAKLKLDAAVSFMAPASSALKAFSSFDDQMRVTQAVTNATQKEFETLSERAQELGRTTSYTAAQVAAGMAELGRAGFSVDEIDKSIANVMNLARATASDLPTATAISGAALRSFGLDASEMGRVCDVLTATANGSAQTVQDLGEALKYVAPLAAQSGTSIEETSKILGALANFGIKGSNAGTAFKNILAGMTNPKKAEIYQSIGVEVVDAGTGGLRNVADVLRDVGDAARSLPDAERLSIFQQLFGMEALAGGAVLTVADGFDALYSSIDNAAGAAEKAAGAMDAGLGGVLRVTQSAIEGVTLALGEALVPNASSLGEAIQSAAAKITEFINQNKNLIATVVKCGAGFAGVVGGLYVFGKAVSIVSSGVSAACSAFNIFSRAVHFLTGATKAAKVAQAALANTQAAVAAYQKAQNALLVASTAAAQQQARAELAVAAAQVKHAYAAQTAAVGTAKLTAAIAANIAIGAAVVAAIGAVVYAVNRYATSAERAVDAARRSADAAKEQAAANEANRNNYAELFNRLEELSNKATLTNEEFEEGKVIVNQLAEAYGDLGIRVNDVTKSFEGVSEAQKKFTEAQRNAQKLDLQEQIKRQEALLSAQKREAAAYGYDLKGEKEGFFTGTTGRSLIKGAATFFGGESWEEGWIRNKEEQRSTREEIKSLQRKLDLLEAQSKGFEQDEAEKKEQQPAEPPTTPPDMPVTETPAAATPEAPETPEKSETSEESTASKEDAEKLAQIQKLAAAEKEVLTARLNLQKAIEADKDVDGARTKFDAATAELSAIKKEAAIKAAGDAQERLIAALDKLSAAKKTADNEAIAAAREELINAQAQAQGADDELAAALVDASTVIAQSVANGVTESIGTFNGFEALDLTIDDWQKNEMKEQTKALNRIVKATEKSAEATEDEDLL